MARPPDRLFFLAHISSGFARHPPPHHPHWPPVSLLSTLMNFLCLCCCSVAKSCPTLCDPVDCSRPGSSVHEVFPGKDTRVGCHSLLQGIFPTQGSNPAFLYWQAGFLPSEPQGSPSLTLGLQISILPLRTFFTLTVTWRWLSTLQSWLATLHNSLKPHHYLSSWWE